MHCSDFIKIGSRDLVGKWPNRFLEQSIKNNQFGRFLL
jgi:hypothetical protein